jgi:hypothetical protein
MTGKSANKNLDNAYTDAFLTMYVYYKRATFISTKERDVKP